MRPADRERVEALVEWLIQLLDKADGDADLEIDPDFEYDPAEQGIADHGALYLFEAELAQQQALAEAQASRKFTVYVAGE